jgi:pyrroline-5-carboxylate reductase
MGETIAIVGAGMMGEALLAGLLRAGRSPSTLIVAERRPERAVELRDRYAVAVLDTLDAVSGADVILLVVKPGDVDAVLGEIRPQVPEGALVVSLAAGITTSFLEHRLPRGTAVVRVMPNTPTLVGEGMAAICSGSSCSSDQLAWVEDLLRATGRVISLPEYQLDAVTALSGSGPAYFFYVVEALVEAGVSVGLPRSVSTDLVVQTLYGAATLLRETGTHPSILREQVTSPAGTTGAALRHLDERGVRAAFIAAVESATLRSKELSQGGS